MNSSPNGATGKKINLYIKFNAWKVRVTGKCSTLITQYIATPQAQFVCKFASLVSTSLPNVSIRSLPLQSVPFGPNSKPMGQRQL